VGALVQSLQGKAGVARSILIAGFFDMFECPDQILHGSLSVSIVVIGHWNVRNGFGSVRPRLLRMGEMHQQRATVVKSEQ
jgi:hypothetical protein